MKSDGGPAFPYPQKTEVHFEEDGERTTYVVKGGYGMSLRDWFAGQALVGIYAGCLFMESSDAAKDAYKTADAMLKEREKGNDSSS